MTKQELRKQFFTERELLGAELRQQMSKAVVTQFLEKFNLSPYHTIHVFLQIEKFFELNTLGLVNELQKLGKKVVVPKVEEKDGQLSHITIDDSTKFSENNWGIKEPITGLVVASIEIDIVLVPLLICDGLGYRIGYGKGFYDRFLAQCRKDCLKVGLNYFEPLKTPIPKDEEDFPLTHCVSPDKVHYFNQPTAP